MKKIEIKEIIKNLNDLGIKKNDVLYVSSDLLNVGHLNTYRDNLLNSWAEIFISILGKNGTIITPSFTESFFYLNKNKNIIFNQNSPSKSGSLSKAILNYNGSIRSKHPTNSYVGWGKYAKQILGEHNEYSLSYTPFKKIIELNGKGLLLGNVGKNGFFPYHYVQEKFGITKNHILSKKFQSYYIDKDNSIKLFTRNDYGGCDLSNYNFLEYFKKNDFLKLGKVGDGEAIIYDGKKIYYFFLEAFKNRNKKLKCNNANCITCFQMFNSNNFHFVFFLLKNLFINLRTLSNLLKRY